MDRSKILSMTAALGVCMVLTLGIWGCAGKAGAPEAVNCPASISWEVAPEAKLTQFECAMGTHGGQESLIFSVGLVNVSDQPMRYRVNIFLDDLDKAAGHLVPRKGNPPVVKPGETASVKIPFIGTNTQSKKIMVLVKPISSE